MVLNIEIQRLLDLYVSRINSIIKDFEILFGTKNPTALWRQGKITQRGFLDPEMKNEYAFHGAGCIVEFSNGELVSFDFLLEDEISFDLFKFKLFVLSVMPGLEDEIDDLFESLELTKKGETWTVAQFF